MVQRNIGLLAIIILLLVNATATVGAASQGQAGAPLLPLMVDHGQVRQNTFTDARFRVDQERLRESPPAAPASDSVLGAVSVSHRPDDPGAVAEYIIRFQTSNALLAFSDLIIFTLDEELYVPGTLDVSQISISADAVDGGTSPAPGQSVAPQEVILNFSGTKSNKPEISLVAPDMDPSDDTGVNNIAAGANVTVIFRQSAGIMNPTESGRDPFKIRVSSNGSDPGADEDVRINVVTPSIVELSSTSDSRGNSVTAIARGFDDGETVTFWRDADADGVRDAFEVDLCSVRADRDNIASCDFSIENPPFVAGMGSDCSGSFTDNILDTGSIAGCNYINARDGDSRTASQRSQEDLDRQIFNLEGFVSASPDHGNPGDTITIQLKSYPAGALAAADLAGVNIPTNADGAAITSEVVPASGEHNFTIRIPDGVPSGTQTLTVQGQGGIEEDVYIIVGGARLIPFPVTVVPNQRLSLAGAGFTKGGLATINGAGDGSSITIGGEVIYRSRINNGGPIEIDDGGSWSAFIDLPVTYATTTEGPRELKVTDSNGRQGTVKITIPERRITIAPAEGRVSADVTVNGVGFAAKNDHASSITIEVSYAAAGAQINTATATPDSVGNWTAVLQVPKNAVIPSTNIVKAEFDLFQASSPGVRSGTATAMTTHQVLPAQITLDRGGGPRGSEVTLMAQGFEQFTSVDALSIGNIDVTPSPKPSTNGDGSALLEFTIPGLDAGVQTVQLRVGRTTASVGFFVTDSDTALANTEVVLGNVSDKLERAFLFNNLSQEWQFFDTRKEFAEDNTLSQIPSGAPLWLKVTHDTQFGINGQFFDLACVNPGTHDEDYWNLIVVP